MAPPTNSPRKRNREDKFFNPGVQGRKTGLTIPENARDELGIEAIGGIFSSPKKSSPARVSTRATRVAPPHQQNGYVDEDIEMSDADGDEMEFASTVGRVLQGPMEDLRVFSSSKGKISLPPPRARSPMKTSLGSSPRRPPSMPPVSSPVPPSRRGYVANPISSSPRKDVEERLTGQSKAVNRRLNFSMDNSTPRGADGSVAKRKSSLRNEAFPPRDGAESSVKKGRVARTSPLRPRHELQQVGDRSKGNKRGLVQMSRDEAEDEEDLSESEIFDAIAQESYQDAGQDMDSYEHGGNSAGGAGDYDDEEVDQEQPSYDEEQEPRSAKTKANAKSDSSKSAGRRGAKATAAEEPQATFPVQKRGRGRPPKRSLPVDDTPADSSQLAEQQEPPSERPAKRGRPAKATKAPKGKVPPSQRNPNARIVSRRTSTAHEGSPGPAQSPKPKTSRKRKSTEVEALTALAARSNYRPHLLAAPDEDPTAVKTRSGRTAVKPMEWWRNEKAIYTDGNSLVAIVRTEEVVKTRKIAGWSKKGGRRRARLEEEEEEEEEAEMEEWEREPGIVMGEVKDWDANLAPGAEVEVIETELAYAPSAIVTRPVPSSSFKYLKTLGLDFFGSGIIDIPAGGSKNRKNSRKMQMAFFVFEGRVRVRVGGEVDARAGEWRGGTEFSIGKGGMWQVPRGNLYAIWNESEKKNSRIFFSQGCEVKPVAEES